MIVRTLVNNCLEHLSIVYCLETPKFIVTTNWLLLSALQYGNPVVKTKNFYCIETRKLLIIPQLQYHPKCSITSICLV